LITSHSATFSHDVTVTNRLELLKDMAETRITPRDEPPPADASEREERAARCRQRPARFRE
jgi:hypothetical protein